MAFRANEPAAAMLTAEALEAAVEEAGAKKVALSSPKVFLLGICAGAFISLGATFMLVIKADASLSFAVSQVLGGLVFCLGLFLVFVAGAELFTGDNLMVCGALSHKYSWLQVLRIWVLVYAGNLVGSLAIAGLLTAADFAAQGSGGVGAAALAVATSKAALTPGVAFARGILCNVLVCLAVWMGFAARNVVEKLTCAVLPVTAFCACGFEHCVANMFFFAYGLLVQGGPVASIADGITFAGVASNLLCSTAGNMVGGAVLVSVVYWLAYGRK